MSELQREHYPLLCDDVSDEELRPTYTSKYQRRFQPILYRGHANNTIKGASAIISRWPEYWTSSFIHWCVGFGMIALTILIVYNSIVAFSMLPSADSKSPKSLTSNKKSVLPLIQQTTKLPEVFMHKIVADYQNININEYLPHIKLLSARHKKFKFNFLVIINDTNVNENVLNAEENNKNALTSLWTTDKSHDKQTNNIKIKYVTLSKHINDSPLRKYWNQLPNHFIDFLVRAVSIWDKGGIAVNPLILTPDSPNNIYLDKLEVLLYNYGLPSKNENETKKKQKLKMKTKKPKKKVNNIRDIIEALEQDDVENISHNLSEAENRLSITDLIELKNSKTDSSEVENNQTVAMNDKRKRHAGTSLAPDIDIDKDKIDKSNSEMLTLKKLDKELKDTSPKNGTESLLPLFMGYLFHEKNKKALTTDDDPYVNKEVLTNPSENSSFENYKTSTNTDVFDNTNNLLPVFVKPSIDVGDTGNIVIEKVNNDTVHKFGDQLTIDLKGNIVATRTACHAFIGTLFTNIKHHTEKETITDLIISELSYFCKGLLSSCKGIDVILL